MCLPGGLVGEVLVGMFGQLPDDRTGQIAAAHIGERFGVDHVIFVTGAQQFEKIAPALGCGRAEPGEAVVAEPPRDSRRRFCLSQAAMA